MKFLVINFIRIHFFFNTFLSLKLKGLGKVQKFLKRDFNFQAFDKTFHYSHDIEGSYDYLLIGKSNEPETHRFFERIFPKLSSSNFVDVGASVGEFVFSVSNYPALKTIIAFEPRPDCAEVLRKNKELNNDTIIQVIENAASNNENKILIHLNEGGTSSGIYNNSGRKGKTVEVECVLLDNILPKSMENTVILVDVEGAEPLVLSGAKSFIANNNPLIVFEYNLTSKKYFDLTDIENIVGTNYTIHRIKNDGSLDQNFEESWNCVAIPTNTIFAELLL